MSYSNQPSQYDWGYSTPPPPNYNYGQQQQETSHYQQPSYTSSYGYGHSEQPSSATDYAESERTPLSRSMDTSQNQLEATKPSPGYHDPYAVPYEDLPTNQTTNYQNLSGFNNAASMGYATYPQYDHVPLGSPLVPQHQPQYYTPPALQQHQQYYPMMPLATSTSKAQPPIPVQPQPEPQLEPLRVALVAPPSYDRTDRDGHKSGQRGRDRECENGNDSSCAKCCSGCLDSCCTPCGCISCACSIICIVISLAIIAAGVAMYLYAINLPTICGNVCNPLNGIGQGQDCSGFCSVVAYDIFHWGGIGLMVLGGLILIGKLLSLCCKCCRLAQ